MRRFLLGLWLLFAVPGFADITSNLEHHWKLDDNADVTCTDSGSGENDGTLTDGGSWVTGQDGYAIDFDGDDSYVDCDLDTSYNGNVNFTIAMIIQPTQNDIDGDRTFYCAYASGDRNYARLWFQLDGTEVKFYFLIDGGDPDPDVEMVSSGASITAGTWYLVVATRAAGGDYELYIDDSSVDTDSNEDATTGAPDAPTIGGDEDGGTHWDGKVDDVRSYTRELSSSDVEELYDALFGGHPSSTPLTMGAGSF